MRDLVLFFLGTVIGAVIGVIADRILGPRIDALQRRFFNWSRRRKSVYTTVDQIVGNGESTLAVRCSETSTGWRPSQVRIRSHGERPKVSEVIATSNLAALFPSSESLELEIEELRRRMDGDEDAQWNCDHLGPRRIDESNDEGGPYVRIDMDVHDWSTHRVLRGHLEARAEGSTHVNPSAVVKNVDRLMSTTLRIFLLVVTADNKLVIGRRGEKEGIDQPSTMCTALEGWVEAKYLNNGLVHIEDVVATALEVQLGVSRDQAGALESLLFHTILLNLETRNWSIHGILDLGMAGITSTDLAHVRSISPGSLHWLADPLEFVPLRRKDIQRLFSTGRQGWMPEALVCLRNSLVLHDPSLLK